MARQRTAKELAEHLNVPFKNQKRSAVREIAARPEMTPELEPDLIREAIESSSPVSQAAIAIVVTQGSSAGAVEILARGDHEARATACVALGRSKKPTG